jgi:hypothetical protein
MRPRAPAGATAALLVALVLSGCLLPASLQVGSGGRADQPSARAGPEPIAPLFLDGHGDAAMEPHVAVRDTGGRQGPVVVVANANKIPGAVPGNALPMSIEVHRSLDGGSTWTSAPLPPSIFDAHDPLRRFSSTGDAVLAYAPGGELFLAGVATTGTSHPDAPQLETLTDFSVFVTRSLDDGATWSAPILWREGIGPSAGVVHDKPWLVAAPDGALHFTWTEFTGLVLTGLHYTRSLDGGATWEPDRDLALPDLTTLSQVTGTTIAAPGGGRVYVSFLDLRGDGSGGRQLVVASSDGGATFDAPAEVGSAAFPRFGQVVADARDPLVAHVVVPSGDATPLLQVASTSDGGATWGQPRFIDPSRGGAQQHPSGLVARGGRLVVGYYDAGWPEGERFTWSLVDADGGVASIPMGPPTAPGIYRREYLGVAGLDGWAWGTWVAGDETAGTQVGVARLRLDGPGRGA